MKLILFILFVFQYVVIYSQTFELAAIEGIPDQVVGAELVKVIFKQAGYHIKITPLPAKRAQHYSSSGILDGEVLRVYEFGEINESLIRVPTPISSVSTTAYTIKSRNIQISSIEDMRNYKIAILRGVLNVEEITRDFDNIERLSSVENLLKFLDSGRSDIIIAGGLGAQSLIIKKGYTDIIPNYIIEELPLYIYLHKKHESYIAVIDEVIKSLEVNGELDKYKKMFEEKYFSRISNLL